MNKKDIKKIIGKRIGRWKCFISISQRERYYPSEIRHLLDLVKEDLLEKII